jgi:hypothetical protein
VQYYRVRVKAGGQLSPGPGLASLLAAGMISEIMNDNGSMARDRSI